MHKQLDNKVKKVIVVNSSDFTRSSAVTSRIKAYCKGLMSNGVDVEIVGGYIVTSSNDDAELPIKGETNGIQYQYVQRRKAGYGVIKGCFYKISFLFKTIVTIGKINHKTRIDYAFLSMDTSLFLWFYTFVFGLFRIKTILIADEYPVAIRDQGKSDISTKERRSLQAVWRFIYGRVFINEKLVEYYNNIRTTDRVMVLPTIIDTDRFQNIIIGNSNKYLCYVGGMDLSNDNVDLIIKAFAKISDKYPEIELHLYGKPKANDKARLENIIKDCHLENKVFLKGYIGYYEVPRIMANACIMVTSQSKTKRAEGGLPTKAGEYLMSGVPSILSDVSTISQFLIHKKHVFIVPPDDINLYADTIEYVLNNYDVAKSVAQVGRQYVENNYSYSVQGKRLVDFLNSVKVY